MNGWKKYIYDVEHNNIITCDLVKLAVKRYYNYLNDDEIYFDESKVNHVFEFISNIKHFKGEFAGKPFILEDWQQFFIMMIFGWYYKENNLRVIRNVFFSVSRKNGKSALIISILLYMLFFSDNAPEIVEAANSREQAKEVLLKTTSEFAKSLDTTGKFLKQYRNEIKCDAVNGQIKIVSADASKLDGLNLNCFVYDEYAEAKNDLLFSVLQSSMGNRKEPLSIICGTVSFNLSSPYHEMYEMSVEILNGLKEDKSFFPLIYTLDENDDVNDNTTWIKANPNLEISVYKDFLKSEVIKGKNNPSYLNKVLTKNFNQWCSTNDVWIHNDRIIKASKKINIKDFEGKPCYVGVDLASVNDLTAVSYLIVDDDRYYFFVDYYLPQSALTEHKQKDFYNKMYFNKYLKITSGNCTDYNFITEDLFRVNNICPIKGIYYDVYNSLSWAVDATEKGLPLIPFSQSVSNFNRGTKEYLRLFLEDKIILEDNEINRFCLNNVFIFRDNNENEKPKKLNDKSKIDGVIAMIQSLACFINTPKDTESFIY